MKPWKLVIFLIILAFVVFFAGFNMNNVSTISFGFYKIEEVPIFISLFVAFLLGAFVMLPFTFRRGKKKEKNKVSELKNSAGRHEIPENKEQTSEGDKEA